MADGELEAMRARANTAYRWIERGSTDGWLPLSVRQHFLRDVPQLIDAVNFYRYPPTEPEADRPPLVLVACALLWIGVAIGLYLPALWRNIALTGVAAVAIVAWTVWQVRRRRARTRTAREGT